MDIAFDAVMRGLELRQRAHAGHGQTPCRPSAEPRQECHEGASTAEFRRYVCTMGPWAKSFLVSRVIEHYSRTGQEATYLMNKVFRELALVNAVVREDRDF